MKISKYEMIKVNEQDYQNDLETYIKSKYNYRFNNENNQMQIKLKDEKYYIELNIKSLKKVIKDIEIDINQKVDYMDVTIFLAKCKEE